MEKSPELGFDIMRMPQKEGQIDWVKSKILIDEYMKGKYCYFDTHPSYMMNQSQDIIREFVVKRYARERFLLANKMPYYGIDSYHDYNVIFNQELDECGVDHFDYYLLHAVSKDVFIMHEKFGGFDFLRKLKKEQKVKNIGFSFHDKPELLEEILQKYQDIDFVQLQINYMDWENPVIQSRACYEIARKYKKEIIVMEPIKGGSLSKKEPSSEYAKLALQFVKSLPGIRVILSGMSELKHIKENRCTLSENNKNNIDFIMYKKLQKNAEKQNTIPCTACGYCIRECPKGIKIPDIFSLMNTYYKPGNYDKTIYGRIRMMYENITFNSGTAGECINCGKCEQRCPQKLPVRKNLKKVMDLFEKKYFYTSERNAQILIYLMKQYKIRKIVASPGTTNIEFVYSVQQDGDFEIYSAPDERSAAYIACGLARESGEPVALSCTGATASRNYIPGLTEAFYRKLPVLAITSTQPTIRIGHNIPQVIDRARLQNDIVKISVEMPNIKDEEDEWYCTINANKAINELWHRGMGPVHINLSTKYSQDFSVKRLPYARVIRRIQKKEDYPDILVSRVAIFCGEHQEWSDGLTDVVDRFCETYGAIVICDHTSNYVGKYRYTPSHIKKENRENFEYDIHLLIHIGNISGAYFSIKAKEVWRINPDGKYCDTFGSLSYVFEMEEQEFFRKYNQNTRRKSEINIAVKDEFRMEPSNMPFSNAWIASQTAHKLPENCVLHLGILNSLRIWNYYQIPKGVRVYSNTGGFGIDGCLSTLVGASLANSKKLYFGVLGDLAFFYDMNVLGNRHIGNNIRLLVINNGCGTEFKNYNHIANIFGEQTDPFIAAKGHYGDQSKELLKDYVEDLGFIYASVSTKTEYLNLLPKLVCSSENSIIVEVFTESKLESEALKKLDEIAPDSDSEREISEKSLPQWLQNVSGKEIVLWGCGYNFSKNIAKVEQYCKTRYVCDNDPRKWNTEIFPGIFCISPDELKRLGNIFVVIMVEDSGAGFDIVHQLQTLGIYHFDMVKNWLKYGRNIEWKTESEL